LSHLPCLDCEIILPACNHNNLFGGALCQRLCSSSHPLCLAWIVGSSCRLASTTIYLGVHSAGNFVHRAIHPASLGLWDCGIIARVSNHNSSSPPGLDCEIFRSAHRTSRLAWIVGGSRWLTTTIRVIHLAWIVKSLGAFIEPSDLLGLWDHPADLQPHYFIWGCILPATLFN